MTGRPRWCGLCGARVSSSSRTLEDPIAYCRAHEDAARAGDELPPDPLEGLPTMAAELREVTHTADEHGVTNGLRVQGARPEAARAEELELDRWRIVDRWWTDEPEQRDWRELRAPDGSRRIESRIPGGEWTPREPEAR